MLAHPIVSVSQKLIGHILYLGPVQNARYDFLARTIILLQIPQIAELIRRGIIPGFGSQHGPEELFALGQKSGIHEPYGPIDLF